MFQIGSSLETLALVDTESGSGCYMDIMEQYRHWAWDSRKIFEVLHDLGSKAPQDEDDVQPGPFISMRGVKRLEIISTEATRSSLIPFMTMLTELECIWLETLIEISWGALCRSWMGGMGQGSRRANDELQQGKPIVIA